MRDAATGRVVEAVAEPMVGGGTIHAVSDAVIDAVSDWLRWSKAAVVDWLRRSKAAVVD